MNRFVASGSHYPMQARTQKFINMKRSIKHIALTAAVIMTLGIGSSFAAPTVDNGQEAISTSFHKDFRQAELLSTTTGKDYTRLTFKMHGVVLSAFYSDNGELLAVTRNIQSSQLPLRLLMNLKNNYTGYWITDLFEIDRNGTSSYFITLENADIKLTLRSGEAAWETYDKTIKE
jgi:hypothetical protein